MKYTSEDKKQLVKEIGYLSKDEHIEIFKLIKNSTPHYTQNDNGIFINLSILDDKIVNKLRQFVNFCIDNRQTLETKDKIIQLEKDKMFSNISEKNVDNETVEKDDQILIEIDKKSGDIEESEGYKIILKKTKPKYTGTKSKIIKNYKQNSNNIQNIIHRNKNKDIKNDEDNENYLVDDYLEDDTKKFENDVDENVSEFNEVDEEVEEVEEEEEEYDDADYDE